MKLIKNKLVWLLLLIGIANGCGSSNDPEPPECFVEVKFDGQTIRQCPDNPTDTTVVLDRPQDEFIWQAMNLYYFWQKDLANLSDDYFADYDELHRFLNRYSKSEELFDDLLSTEDRFSWIADDYVALEQSLQGIAKSFGYEFRLLRVSEGSNDLFGYVKYVIPESPADLAGLTRGKLFNSVNGKKITVDNYFSELYENDSHKLAIAVLQDDQVVSTGEMISLEAVQLIENPIHLSKVMTLDDIKVGYLVYNQFINNNQAHRELNNVFGDFNNQGIQELVIDLRYNAGGSLTSTLILASLIYGNTSSSSNFGSLVYNSKLSNYFSSSLNFYDSLPIFDDNGETIGQESMNRLNNLTRVFVLTSSNTASASEFLIVGLSPFVDVFTVGTKTVGKNVASTTLYDSKTSFLFRRGENAEINQDHTYAIQPIISKLVNSEGFSDYSDGLEPDVVIDEKDFLLNLKPLGDFQEPLLEEVINIIRGTATARTKSNTLKKFQPIPQVNPKQIRLQRALIDLERI